MESRKLQAFESRIQLKESEILLMIRIWNPQNEIQNPRLSWITLHEAINFL